MTYLEQLQLPKPSLAWTVPPDLGLDEAMWPWHDEVPGSKRDLPGGGWVRGLMVVGWVRGPYERTRWELQVEKQRVRVERLKRRWARQKVKP